MNLKLHHYVAQEKLKLLWINLICIYCGEKQRNRQLTCFYLSPCSLRCSCVSCSSARRLSTGPLKTISTFLLVILTLFIAIAPYVFVIVVLKLRKGLVQKLNEFPFLRQSPLAFVVVYARFALLDVLLPFLLDHCSRCLLESIFVDLWWFCLICLNFIL